MKVSVLIALIAVLLASAIPQQQVFKSPFYYDVIRKVYQDPNCTGQEIGTFGFNLRVCQGQTGGFGVSYLFKCNVKTDLVTFSYKDPHCEDYRGTSILPSNQNGACIHVNYTRNFYATMTWDCFGKV